MKKRENSLSDESMERLWLLNKHLQEAKTWARERSERTLAAYLAGGGAAKARGDQPRPAIWEDYELEIVVKCSLCDRDPAFNPADAYGNLIGIHDFYDHDDGETDGYNWNEGVPRIGILADTNFCYWFHELYDHQMHRDLGAVARIGEIEIDLVFRRQRMVSLEEKMLPRKRKSSYPRSVFARTPLDRRSRLSLTARERRYARLLNRRMEEANAWIVEQNRLGEEQYFASGGKDACTDGDRYEDYIMEALVDGVLGSNHPEYDEDDSILVTWETPMHKKNEYIFGRSRLPCFDPSFWFSKAYLSRSPYEKPILRPCGLFHILWDKVDSDWLKMLSIGGLWLEAILTQRWIVRY